MRAMSVELTGVPSSPDVVVISSDESDRPRPPKRRKTTVVDIEDCARPHPQSYHSTADVAAHQDALLRWFETVRWVESMHS